jgi:hypothetical protein
MNNELERMWKEAAIDYFRVLLQWLSTVSEKNHKNPQFGYAVSWPIFKSGATRLQLPPRSVIKTICNTEADFMNVCRPVCRDEAGTALSVKWLVTCWTIRVRFPAEATTSYPDSHYHLNYCTRFCPPAGGIR